MAACSAADDTESLDDPDDPRTEDISLEIQDESRSDYEPVCDSCSSGVAANNVGVETGAPGGVAPLHIPQSDPFSTSSGSLNGGFQNAGASFSQVNVSVLGTDATTGVPPISQPTSSGGSTSTQVSQSHAVATSSTFSSTTSTASCSSRFRVIKLDHGTGEPYRRGRWTCTEFYEKDSEGRTVDGIRHTSNPLADPDRDSGLGMTGSSLAALSTHSGQGMGSVADASHSASQMHSVDTRQQQVQHQYYTAGQLVVNDVQANNKARSNSIQGPHQPSGGPAGHYNIHTLGHNGLPQATMQIHKSPTVTSTALNQSLTHALQQLQPSPGHHPASEYSEGIPANQPDYYQQHQSVASAGQTLPMSSLPGGQGHDTSAGTPARALTLQSQGLELAGAAGVSFPISEPVSSMLQHTAGGIGSSAGGSMLLIGSTLQQQPVGSQYAPAGQPQLHGLHLAQTGAQNVPAPVVSSSVPTTMPSASSGTPAMPNPPTSTLPLGQQPTGALSLAAARFGQLEASSTRRIDGIGGTQQPPLVAGKDLMKPLIPESLQLATPTVNSLFGIAIPVEGDEDSASGASVVAIDNKIEQAMDLVKSHLMYAVREEVEVLKEQIKELFERNSLLERENAVLKSLANSEQLSQLPVQAATDCGGTPPQQGAPQPLPQPQGPLLQQPQPQPDPSQSLQPPPPHITSA